MNRDSKLPFDENAGLMRKASDDDIRAFKRLYQKYAPLLMKFLIVRGADRNSAEDLVQKIFTCLWERRESLRGASFEAYLFGIARHILSKEIRQSHKITEIISKKKPVSDEGTYKSLSQPEAELYFKELTKALEAAKAKLTDEQIQALEVALEPDIDLDKKLEELGWSKEAYKGHLKRARKSVREDLTPIFLEDLKHKKRRKRP